MLISIDIVASEEKWATDTLMWDGRFLYWKNERAQEIVNRNVAAWNRMCERMER